MNPALGSLAYMDFRYGFKDLDFGKPLPRHLCREGAPHQGDVCLVPGQEFKLEPRPVILTDVSFGSQCIIYQDKLYCVEGKLSEEDHIRDLHKILTLAYGQPTKTEKDSGETSAVATKSLTWIGQRVRTRLWGTGSSTSNETGAADLGVAWFKIVAVPFEHHFETGASLTEAEKHQAKLKAAAEHL